MKLGVSYIVFDGVELLEHSIKQIRKHVDYIQVVYQTESWFGHPIKNEDLIILNSLKVSGLVDELSKFSNFTPLRDSLANSIAKAKTYEREKRYFGLKSAIKKGCTHYLCMDVDEFYIEEQFANAKSEVEKNDYGLTAARFINYVKLPTLHRGYDPSRVPFICKVDESSAMTSRFFVKCDPTRGIASNVKTTHEFDHEFITMHHMETVRKDLKIKYEATTRAIFKRASANTLIDSINRVSHKKPELDFNKIIFPSLGKIRLKSCENIFEIPYDEWKK
jgi:hypothetical protein